MRLSPGEVEFMLGEACSTLKDVREADLVFMDPPFNIGEPYPGGDGDRRPLKEYLHSMNLWVSYAREALKDTGSLWLHLPDALAAHGRIICEQHDLIPQGWIIWHYRFGVCQPHRFIVSKCHGLWFSKTSKPKVYPERAYVPSDRATLYDDPRTVTGERMDLDVWGFEKFWGRVQGNNKERRPLHPNQLPEVYIKRIVEVCTDEGDLVVDPFCGSGTTAVVAATLKRCVVTGDISAEVLESAKERVTVKGAVRV